MSKKLWVYLHQGMIGELVQNDDGQLQFRYDAEWLDNPHSVSISHTLPLQKETFSGKICHAFFAGLLPEENKREIIARNLGISARNDFAMLEQIGGECAGALTFISPESSPLEAKNSYQLLTENELEKILLDLPEKPLMAGEKDIRLSLAGAQDKLAVFVEGENIFLPKFNSPSTHIIKPAVSRFKGIVYNEAFCLRLAKEMGLPAAESKIFKAGSVEYLLITRYDRKQNQKKMSSESLLRIHQEDFCQALGYPPELKYQSEGGPSLKKCFNLLREVSSTPVIDLQNLLDIVIFNFLIGNHDAHGKNFSLLYHKNQVNLAPFYDLLSTAYYPDLTPKMAMKIGGEYQADKISILNFQELALEAGFSQPMVVGRVSKMANELFKRLSQYNFVSEIEKKISDIILGKCRRLIQ